MEKDEVVREMNAMKEIYLEAVRSLPPGEKYTTTFQVLFRLLSDLGDLAYKAEHGITWTEYCAQRHGELEEKRRAADL